MCVININVDEERLRRISPSFKDASSISRWLQIQVDELIDEMMPPKNLSPNAHSADKMHSILEERIRRAESGEEELIPGEVVFDSIRTKSIGWKKIEDNTSNS